MKREIIPNFIVFEGIDGSGTTTQLSRAGSFLAETGVPVRLDCEPTRGPIGCLIRQSLNDPKMRFAPETLSRLFAADRHEHLYGKDGVVEACARPSIVISDRYLFSSLAYQGITCGSDLPAAQNGAFPLPEFLFFFDAKSEVTMKRLESRETLDMFENKPFQARVETAYRTVIGDFMDAGMHVTIIDAMQPIDRVTTDILQVLAPLAERYRKN